MNNQTESGLPPCVECEAPQPGPHAKHCSMEQARQQSLRDAFHRVLAGPAAKAQQELLREIASTPAAEREEAAFTFSPEWLNKWLAIAPHDDCTAGNFDDPFNPPSCMCCGRVEKRAVQHLVHADIYICESCHTAALAARALRGTVTEERCVAAQAAYAEAMKTPGTTTMAAWRAALQAALSDAAGRIGGK